MEWYIKVLKQYADFGGRARRKEYWMFTLFNVIIICALTLVMLIGTATKSSGLSIIGTVLYCGYALAIIVPSLAVCVRRLHDIGKSGWYYFIGLIPLVGGIILLIWFCKESQAGENEYGANPKELTSDNDDSTCDTVVLFAVIFMFVNRLFWVLIQKLYEQYYLTEWFKPVDALLGFVWAIIPISLAFAVKNKSKQMALFILGAIFFLYSMYAIITLLNN